MLATDAFIGAQLETMAIPLGVLLVAILWFYFQRPPTS